MTRKLFNIAALIAVGAVALTFAADGRAGLLDKLQRKKVAKKQTGAVSVGGMYSGSLGGQIQIQGRKVLITPKTVIYVIGQGARDGKSMVVTQTPVAASGQMSGKVLVADVVVVRPTATTVRLDRPDDGSVTWGPNPNVGVLNGEVER